MKIGSTIRRFALLDSTIDTAAELVLQGAPEGLVVVAGGQRRGRGRHGRVWNSPPNQDLLLAVVLKPRPSILPLLTFSTALSIGACVAHFGGTAPSYKWPNDVLAEGHKLAGVLIESTTTGNRTTTIIGIGLNVNMDATYATPLNASSLRICSGAPLEVEKVFQYLLEQLDIRYHELCHGRSPLDEWRAALVDIGRMVTVHNRFGGSQSGTAITVNEEGHLLVKTGAGVIAVNADEVSLSSLSPS